MPLRRVERQPVRVFDPGLPFDFDFFAARPEDPHFVFVVGEEAVAFGSTAIAVASPLSKLAEVLKSGGKRASIFPSWAPTNSAGTPRKTPTASAASTPSTAAHGPQFA